MADVDTIASARTIATIRGPFRAIASAVVPDMATLDDAGWQQVERYVAIGLAARPPDVRRQLALFVRVVNALAVLRYGRPLAALSIARRHRLLAGLERAPFLLIRRGLWGVRTLALMGYYCQDAARTAVGYAGDPRGWARLGKTAGAWPDRNGAAPPEPGQPTGGGATGTCRE